MNFDEPRQQILQCRLCEPKFGFEPVPIFQGTERSAIVQIGQAPSSTVHMTKKPFNDASGQKLKYKWYEITDEIFYNEDFFYITAMAHCFPGKNAKGGDNPPPLACARKWLKQEFAQVHNEIYIIIGAKAAKFLFPDDSFEELVFKDSVLNGKPAYVLPHPSPLNVRWFKDHPQFEEQRICEIRKVIWRVLGLRTGEQE
ncbi:uracil-DNA glycosylase family protein [Paenibacillus kobensis]|uniref:uracil-DNA glycosylase family protein n=1 Tax=Paenibacillus kobensis TaxID=59841 RepID=UPI000FD9804B|nr:uracil-DNA glycosylase family protein [Paenibacillus kobensis]